MLEEAAVGTAADEFEARIAAIMRDRGVSYFGRLVMTDEHEGSSKVGNIITAVRFGSLNDAVRGTALTRELLYPELSRWFKPLPTTIMGTAIRVLEV
jgi:hypothetical protein